MFSFSFPLTSFPFLYFRYANLLDGLIYIHLILFPRFSQLDACVSLRTNTKSCITPCFPSDLFSFTILITIFYPPPHTTHTTERWTLHPHFAWFFYIIFSLSFWFSYTHQLSLPPLTTFCSIPLSVSIFPSLYTVLSLFLLPSPSSKSQLPIAIPTLSVFAILISSRISILDALQVLLKLSVLPSISSASIHPTSITA